MSTTSRAAICAAKSDPDKNAAFRGWSLQPLPLGDADALARLADAAFAAGHFRAADRLGWLAAAREVTP